MTMDITSYGDGGWKVTLVAAILIIMQVLAVSGRIISRSMKKARLAVDDYVLIFGTVSKAFVSLFIPAQLTRTQVLTFTLCALAMTCKCHDLRVDINQRLRCERPENCRRTLHERSILNRLIPCQTGSLPCSVSASRIG